MYITQKSIIFHELAILEGREKLATQLMEDPNLALRVVARVTQLSAPSPEMGKGLPKTAAADGKAREDDPWLQVIIHGAA